MSLDVTALREVLTDLHDDSPDLMTDRMTRVAAQVEVMTDTLDPVLQNLVRGTVQILAQLTPAALSMPPEDQGDLLRAVLSAAMQAAMEMGIVIGQEYGRRGFTV